MNRHDAQQAQHDAWRAKDARYQREAALERLARAHRDHDHNAIPHAENALQRLIEEARSCKYQPHDV